MTVRSINRHSIEREAENLLRRIDEKAPPVDVERVAKELGIRIEQASFREDCSGVLIRREDGSAVIGVNWDHHPNRQRFTIAHECGHFRLHEGGTYVDKGYARFRDEESGSGTVAEERQANQFAAALLMPSDWVRGAFQEQPFDPADDFALAELAERFQVSTQAMMFRLSNLGLLKL